MKPVYDGYCFSQEAEHTVFNSSLCLYYLDEMSLAGKFLPPEDYLDPASNHDGLKLQQLFDIAEDGLADEVISRNSRHLILTTRVLVLCTVLLYSTHSLQFVFTRSVLYCGWTLHFKLRIYFVHLFYRLRGQQVFRKYLNNLILEY